jgi:hypothetical protein
MHRGGWGWIVAAGALGGAAPGAERPYAVEQGPRAIRLVAPDGQPIAAYVTALPADSPLSVASACFFHPLYTPRGRVVTDLAPEDHRHHRGVFLAWVEMHGQHDADFWGWGEHAPKEGRVIEFRSLERAEVDARQARVELRSAWRAEQATLIDEQLTVTAARRVGGNVLDLEYRLTPRAELRLARWAFSGFCVRLTRRLPVTYTDPQGPVERPFPDHLRPESNWPAADWYDGTVRLADGEPAGVAVIDHPQNLPALWHNEGRIAMLNPAIVAAGEVRLAAGQALVLRYRVVAHDGPAPREELAKLAREFRGQR